MTSPVFITRQDGLHLTIDRSDILGFWRTGSHPDRTTVTVASLGMVVIDEPYEGFIDRMSAELVS